jgi:hypothetical protein
MPVAKQKLMFHSNAFRNNTIIFYPPTKQWVTSSDCVWEAKRGFATRLILAKHYPDQKHLFHECLKIPNADVDMVLEQITALSSDLVPDKSTVTRLQQLLLALSCHLSELPIPEAANKIRGKLKDQHIIPIHRMEDGVRMTKLMRLDWDFWFYAHNKRYISKHSMAPTSGWPIFRSLTGTTCSIYMSLAAKYFVGVSVVFPELQKRPRRGAKISS